MVATKRKQRFVDTGHFHGREQGEKFPAADLDVDVFVVVLVEGGGGPSVAEPEVDGVGRLFEGGVGERDG
jgi:hypothetical protein